jgi:hypothetical protein
MATGEVATSWNWAQVSVAVLKKMAESGMSTIKLK